MGVVLRARRVGAYVLSFGLGRGALFGAPLVLANVLAGADYGGLETAQAAGSLVANAATLGTASAVPLVLLADARNTTLAGIVAHHLGLVALGIAVALVCWLVGTSAVWPLAALFTAAVALQSLASTHLKTLGQGEASVLLDAGLFGLMALAAVGAHLSRAKPMPWVVAAVVLYVATLLVAYVRVLLRRLAEGEILRWRAALALGLPLMLGGIVSLLATTSGRLGMGLLASPLATADYAVLARAAALPIVAHQLILIARFRNLYTQPDAAVERAATQIVLLVAASALGFCVLSPWLGHWLGPAFAAAWRSYPTAGWWIAAQAVLWSSIALNDLVIARHQAMARVLPISAGFITLALAVGALWMQHVGTSLQHFVQAHGLLMVLFYGVQSAVMHKLGLHLWRTWLAALGTYLLLILLATTLA